MPKVKIDGFEVKGSLNVPCQTFYTALLPTSLGLLLKFLCSLFAVLWMIGCTKEPEANGHVQVDLCLSNKTENDFTGDSYVELFTIRDNNLPKNQTNCWGQLAGGVSWTAHLKFKTVEFATWSGGVNLPETEPSITTEMTNANKTFDFRDPIIGKYDLVLHCANVDIATNDTLTTNSGIIAGEVIPLLNVLNLKIVAGADFDNTVTFSEDPYNFITSDGMTGSFSAIDRHLEFSTKKITAPGIETRCLYQGEKQ